MLSQISLVFALVPLGVCGESLTGELRRARAMAQMPENERLTRTGPVPGQAHMLARC